MQCVQAHDALSESHLATHVWHWLSQVATLSLLWMVISSTFVLHVVIHIDDFCNQGGGERGDCLRGNCEPTKQAATGIKNSHLSDRILALLERNWLETRKEWSSQQQNSLPSSPSTNRHHQVSNALVKRKECATGTTSKIEKGQTWFNSKVRSVSRQKRSNVKKVEGTLATAAKVLKIILNITCFSSEVVFGGPTAKP